MWLPKQFMRVMPEQVAPIYWEEAAWAKGQLGLNCSSQKKALNVPAAIASLTL